MPSVCFYFQVHQPYRLRRYSVFEIGNNQDYFDHDKNRQVMEKVANKCYRPMNMLLLDLIKKLDGKFKVAFSITGVALEQFEKYTPDVIDLFRELAKTGHVEFLAETYYHSLSYLKSKEEFESQVKMHSKKMHDLFGVQPKVFRNTELIFNNEIANFVEGMGYKGIIAEGADHVLGWRSPNYLYQPVNTRNIKLLLKNYKLSDDIAFRFGNKSWEEYPMTSEKFASWIASNPGDTVNLFMDYETFGEHQWEDTGIFNFMRQMPYEILKHGNCNFKTPSELVKSYNPVGVLDVHHMISWADIERDLSAWLGNKIQHEALHSLFEMEREIKETNDEKLIEDWRKLTTSDHFYYMCTKWFADGDVHKYFNPYDSPYESFIAFMNVLNDMQERLKKHHMIKSERTDTIQVKTH